MSRDHGKQSPPQPPQIIGPSFKFLTRHISGQVLARGTIERVPQADEFWIFHAKDDKGNAVDHTWAVVNVHTHSTPGEGHMYEVTVAKPDEIERLRHAAENDPAKKFLVPTGMEVRR